MQTKKAYFDQVLREVEELASRVSLLKSRLARQESNVGLEHHLELAYIRTRFAEFQLRLEGLEEDDDLQSARDQEAVEAAWQDLMHAIDVLLAALP